MGVVLAGSGSDTASRCCPWPGTGSSRFPHPWAWTRSKIWCCSYPRSKPRIFPHEPWSLACYFFCSPGRTMGLLWWSSSRPATGTEWGESTAKANFQKCSHGAGRRTRIRRCCSRTHKKEFSISLRSWWFYGWTIRNICRVFCRSES